METTTIHEFKHKFKELYNQRQFYWWLGHICTICNSLLYISSLLSFNPNSTYYKSAFMGTLLSYSVVIFNSMNSTNLILDENVHYLLIGIYWLFCKPIAVTLLPFLIFSIFHSLSYINAVILPLFLNSSTTVVNSLEEYNIPVLYCVAYIEVFLITSRLIIGVLLFRTSFLALVIFIQFLKLRYYLSPYTNEAIITMTDFLDNWLLPKASSSSALGFLSRFYLTIKSFFQNKNKISENRDLNPS